MTEQQHTEWIGKTIVWAHGANTLTGIATSFDADDNEFYLPVDGLVHAHVWVPAGECRIERPVPTTDESPSVLIPGWVLDQPATDLHGNVIEPVPSVPTREQIADYTELRADLATMARQDRTPDHWAIGRNQRTARSALVAIDTLLALIEKGTGR